MEVGNGIVLVMDDEIEVLKWITYIYADLGWSEPLDLDLLDLVEKILEKKPSPRLERIWRGYKEYVEELGSDSVLFQELLKAAQEHIF